MLLCLAGSVAESVVHEQHINGCSSDFKEWEVEAKRFLSNDFGGFFFKLPHNALELEHNIKALKEMKATQIKTLEAFFNSNKSVLINLSESLEKKKVMTKKDLLPYFEQIKFDGVRQYDLEASLN